MSEVPIKHFWDTPHLVLDMSLLTNRIAELQDEVTTLTRERDALRKDAARLDWLEAAHTLPNNVEIHSVAGGYNVDVMHHDGATCYKSSWAETLREAIDAAMEAKP
jgi:hypothetical protein